MTTPARKAAPPSLTPHTKVYARVEGTGTYPFGCGRCYAQLGWASATLNVHISPTCKEHAEEHL